LHFCHQTGKTECTKHCLQYLANVAGSGNGNVETRILLSNPILESFGNAKTLRNNNSSRFGKYLEIFFNHRFEIGGGQNTNYLLEKSRVVIRGEGERSYHIFYQMVTGLEPKLRRFLELEYNPSSYFYLSQSNSLTIDGVNDVEEFNGVLSAMYELGFSQDEMNEIWKLLSALLHLGNISFVETGDRRCEPGNDAAVEAASKLLMIDPFALVRGITVRVMHTKGQPNVDITLGVSEAEAQRDSISKHIYYRLFDLLVNRVNQAIGISNECIQGRTIGILDIFGFEIFDSNSFEQLCINYTNEKLQQNFNEHTFKLEEEVYKKEKIQYSHVFYIDNTPVLNLIEGRPTGVLSLIDEELRVPAGSDRGFSQKLQNYHRDKPEVFSSAPANSDFFMIHHYAGSVIYDPEGWVVKNRDRLNEDALEMIYTTQSQFMRILFPQNDANSAEATKKKGLGLKFKVSCHKARIILETEFTLQSIEFQLTCK